MVRHGPSVRYISLKETRKRSEVRAEASLHCPIYNSCLTKYSTSSKQLPCYKCKLDKLKPEKVRDVYKKELHDNYFNLDSDKLPLRLPR